MTLPWMKSPRLPEEDRSDAPISPKFCYGKVMSSRSRRPFDLYLAKGGPAYLDKFRFFPREAIEVILEAGGLPVLAHPFSLKLDHTTELESLIAELVEYGLVGLEVYYSKHTPEMTDYYLGLAEKVRTCSNRRV